MNKLDQILAHERMQQKYPEAIKVLIERLTLDEPRLVHHCRLSGIPGDDMYGLINAAMHYHKKEKV